MGTNILFNSKTMLHLARDFFLILLLFYGCNQEFGGYYDTPEGLAGPIYEQLKNEPDFSEFTKAIDKIPVLKRAINSSGLYTVFAPTNEAIAEYLTSQGKSSIDDYDMSNADDSLAIYKLVNGHILFNMYFKIDFDKYIDEKEELINVNYQSNDVYRFGSRYREPDYWYYDKNFKLDRKVLPGYKVLSVYTQEYIDKYKMSQDYQDIYGVAPGDFNIEGAQILIDKRDIPAKNGVIHGINKVLEVRPAIDKILAEKNPYYSNLLEKFVILRFREMVGNDSIFYKDYMYVFNFASDNNVGTILCPAIGTFDDFVQNTVLTSFYNSFDSVPDVTAEYLLSEYIIFGRKWLSDIQTGVINILGDTIVNPDISEKVFASNGIVYVINDLLLSSAFTTVVKVPMLDIKFSWFLEMLYESNSDFINYLKYKDGKFTFFVPTNTALENYGVERRLSAAGEMSFYKDGFRMLSKQIDSLLNYMIIPNYIIRPEDMNTYKWYPTRSGNFLNFENGAINSDITCFDPQETDNGYAYTLEVMPVQPKMTISLYLANTEETGNFRLILETWPWNETTEENLDYLLRRSDGSNSFTVFVPTDQALQEYKDANALEDYDSVSVWQDIGQYHIVKTRLYSEGSFQRKADNPLPEDSSKFVTVYKDIVYSPDNIFDNDHYAWLQFDRNEMKIIDQNGNQANIISTYDIETMNGVIHHIDKVLTPPVKQYPDNE
jgi:uncharacterized surface protein with fasciclin (FAS1) repeats